MLIGFNDVEAARVNGVKKLMNLDSKCIYPKMTRFNLEKELFLTLEIKRLNYL